MLFKKITFVASIAVILISGCENKQETVKFTNVQLRQAFGRLNLRVPNLYKSDSYTQWPDNTNDHLTCYEEYEFVAGKDSARLSIEMPLTLNLNCISKDSVRYEQHRLEGQIRTIYRDAENFEPLQVKRDGFSLYGINFNQGFCVGGCVRNGFFFITLTGVHNKAVRDSLLQSLQLYPY